MLWWSIVNNFSFDLITDPYSTQQINQIISLITKEFSMFGDATISGKDILSGWKY